jgi:hypothetical protein
LEVVVMDDDRHAGHMDGALSTELDVERSMKCLPESKELKGALP